VLELLSVGEICRASTLRNRRQSYFLPVECLRAREEEESRSDKQEEDDIDDTGEVEH
jgi:hypothetical protein